MNAFATNEMKNNWNAREAAYRYVERGWKVLPIRSGTKIPATQHGFKDASNDHKILDVWFEDPATNIGIATGEISGLIVIDVDSHLGGTLDELEKNHGQLPETLKARSRAGGMHYYFRLPKGVNIPSSAGGIAPHVDVRGNGGYIVAPPSHVNSDKNGAGGRYEWLNDSEISVLPSAWVLLLTSPPRPPHTPKAANPSGSKNHALIHAIPLHNLPAENAEEIEQVKGMLAVITPDCGMREWLQIGFAIKSLHWTCGFYLFDAWSQGSKKYDPTHTRNVWKETPRDGEVTYGTLIYLARKYGWKAPQSNTVDLACATEGDIYAGRKFANLQRGKLLFSQAAGKWLRWDGSRWVWCQCGEEMAAAKVVAETILDKAFELTRTDPEKYKKLIPFALRLQNLPKLEAMIALAKSEEGMSIGHMSEFDSDPLLLGVRNGVVNLSDGGLLSSDPKMLITRQAGAEYDHEAECPRWLKFLSDIFEGDEETISYIQRALGYTLTGLTGEEVLFICHGYGANGKSVFANVVSEILGEYGQMAPPTLLTVRRDGDTGPRNDIARLCGARLVSINETQSGDRLDEQVVKMLAGRETLSARFLHREFFDFKPTAKPWLRTNHRPIVTGDDDGIWRRLHLIPFAKKFAENERNPNLENQLLDERVGILRWMVEGALAWKRMGLAPSKRVCKESGIYRNESDLIGEFLQDKTQSEAEYRVEQSQLFNAWMEWSKANGTQAGSKKTFTRKLAERGYSAMHSNGKRFYVGLRH